MTLTNYSDTTPDVSIEYEPLGRISSETSLVSSVSQSSVSYTYNPTTLALDKETITYTLPGQPAFTRILDRSQDTLLRDSGWVLGSTPASGVGGGATPPPELVTSYAYNPTDGRLETIRGGGLHPPSQFSYSYVPNSNLLATITGPAHTVTNTYEPNRDVLDVKQNKAGTSVISRYDYTVNAIGQRSNVAQSGTAFAGSRDIAWGYDSLGQVTRADSTILGLDRAYQFDLIGNRLKTADSLTLPVANNYTPNALNQYTAIDTLNPVHDDDGNMTSGPLPANVNANSTLIWDGENRLIQAQVTGGATVTFIYDSQSRRIAETVGTVTKITVYDGWNPIAEYWRAGLQPASLAKSFIWGIDLSGSLQGAGGVGGLLAVTDSTGTYYPTYDGNGNVSEYLDSTGAVVAHYEYDPFGKTTVATGPKANDFSHRFSTKPLDITTGLYYYAYRYYDPVTGRWPSRDPIEEEGGINLYGFVYNAPYDFFDDLGHEPKSQSNDKRRQASVDNSNGKNSNKTIESARKANSGAATFDPNTSPSNGATAAIDAIGLVQDWAGDINGLLGIKAKEKACSELAKKRKNELGWTSCKACCVVAFTAPRETGHRALTNRIIRDDLSYHYFNVYEGECVYGDGGTADQMKKDLGPDKASREYAYANGNVNLRYSLNDIEL